MTPLTPLPGALPPPESIQQQLAAALEEELGRHADFHTRNIGPDGKPLFTNRLILSTSPYLHQHAHNPVDWRPWGPEAFAEAKKLNRPVFLSVGYSTCHWCHVMARESFEDIETARVMNERYINIKVDREERPDVDSLYMTSVQLFTGQGGWPMSVWLTPDGKPYYGGTYFPPSDRYGRPGFADIMTQLADYYARQPAEAAGRGEQVVERIRHFSTVEKDGLSPAPGLLKDAVATLARNYDPEWGGFGHAPKFPKAMEVDFLLRIHRRTGDAKTLAMITTTLDRMAEGGMYDQVGGGFHRYSVDGEWLVPHFEKMLYDNALLASAYTEAFQATGRKAYARIARETLDYLVREMQDQRGGFHSATDADSEGEEGKFFVWSVEEVNALLGKDAAAFIAFYQMSEGGNFEGHNIPRLARGSLADTVPPNIAAARKVLYAARAKRIHPHLDDKVLASWNGLIISALAKAGFVLDEPRYVKAAERAADFVLTTMTRNGRLLRSARDGKADHPAFLTDYANMIAGLLDFFESTQQRRWLTEARRLQALQDKHFHDADSGCYFFTASDHETLIAREIPIYDNARPSGNSVSLHNLWRLAEYAGDDAMKERALACAGSLLPKMGGGHSPVFLSAIERMLDKSKEIVIVGDDPAPMVGLVRATYLPNRALMVLRPSEAADTAITKELPLVANKTAQEGRTTAYVCMDKLCLEPATELAAFARQLSQAEPLEPSKADRP